MEDYLKEDYLVVSMDFQGISTEEYENEFTFTKAFMRMFAESLKDGEVPENLMNLVNEFLEKPNYSTLSEMFYLLSDICQLASRPIVMMIDEVDSASNNQVFIDFLAMLRKYYIKRRKKTVFHSVILAGVYDIKNLKLKIRSDGIISIIAHGILQRSLTSTWLFP